MSRPQLTKQLWVYIKANGLQDPNDGRNIIPDDRLAAAFGGATFTSTPLPALARQAPLGTWPRRLLSPSADRPLP